MNYIREINSFYVWLETNSVPDSAVVLWHALMHTCSKARWVVEFAVAISTLESKTGLKKDAIIRARQRLKQLNRIDFRSREGKLSAIYSLIPFGRYDCVVLNDTKYYASDCVVLSDTKCVTNRALSATQTASQTASIIKLNNIFDSDDDMNNHYPRAPEEERYEFCKGIFLSEWELQTLNSKFPPKRSLDFVRFYSALSRMKEEGYKPPGSDFDELLRMINAEQDAADGYG